MLTVLKSSFRRAIRSQYHNKLYSFINITGLAIGMATSILIVLWIWDELSFERGFERYDHIAQVMNTETSNGEMNTSEAIAMPLAAALRNNYASQFENVSLVYPNFDHSVAAGEKKVSASGVWAEPGFAEMLTLKMVVGKRDALTDPSSVLIDESLASTLFGKQDPEGKTVRIDNKTDVRVAGVYEDFPRSTRFYGTKLMLSWNKALVQMPNLKKYQDKWDTRYWWLFVQTNDRVQLSNLNEKIKDIPQQQTPGVREEIFLHPMSKWHLYSEFKNGKAVGGRIELVGLFGIISAFVLLLACINFINLSTARSTKRAREVGILKTLGAARAQLIGQFLTESFISCAVALAVALTIVMTTLPFLSQLTEKAIAVPFGSPVFWLLLLGFTIFTAMVSGSFPAFYLSSFKTISVLKSKASGTRVSSLPRSALIIFQFTISVVLVIAAIVVSRQIRFAMNRSAGYTRERLISVNMNTYDVMYAPYNALRKELMETDMIDQVAKSSSQVTEGPGSERTDITWMGKDPIRKASFNIIGVTHDFGHTIGWQMLAGRDFSRSFLSDSDAVVINQAAAKITGFTDPVGQTIYFDEKPHKILGVVQNIIMESPYAPVEPTLFYLNYDWAVTNLLFRVAPKIRAQDALAKAAEVFKKYNPGGAFDYRFVDEQYDKKFLNEKRIGIFTTIFTAVALVISCLGLFGLATFMAEQRAKEIGIRKVLGASLISIWGLLSLYFIRLVTISLVIAFPVGYLLLHRWLQGYPYSTAISAYIFVWAGGGSLLLTLMVVSYQSFKTALTNPVKGLRRE